MILMLEITGFQDIQVKGDWSEEDFRDGHGSTVFMARRG
jgi:hypothetical protein